MKITPTILKSWMVIVLVIVLLVGFGCAQEEDGQKEEQNLQNQVLEPGNNQTQEEVSEQLPSDEMDLLYDDGLDDALAELELLADLSGDELLEEG